MFSDPPFVMKRGKGTPQPVLVSSPHSGSVYPKGFIDQSRLDGLSLRRSEDAFVDELVEGCLEAGFDLLCAQFPRAYVDVNRHARELDPKLFHEPIPDKSLMKTARTAYGLGVIPKIVADNYPIYAGKISLNEGLERINSCYVPYHLALGDGLKRLHADFGFALLLDMHSMPTRAWNTKDWPDIILGDRFGASSDQAITCFAEHWLSEKGLKVVRNKPYAGGYITERYGRPSQNYHALQIEISRGLYMDEEDIVKTAGFEDVQQVLTGFFQAMAGFLEGYLTQRDDLAAE